jgi:hypothetical protein
LPVVAPYTPEIYMIPAGKTQFSNIPYEFDSILVLEVCSRYCESMGDIANLEIIEKMIKKAYDSVAISMGNRLSSQRKRVTDPNNIGMWQRQSSFYRYR